MTYGFVSELLHPAVEKCSLSNRSGHVPRDVELEIGETAAVGTQRE